MQSRTATFWKEYYAQAQQEGVPWLDCSNDRVHLQTIALALEAAGRVHGRRCLELGCGRGQLSRCLSVLGAGELVAVDLVEQMLKGHSERYPEVRWVCADLQDRQAMQALGTFDLIFALEVLQYVPLEPSLRFFAGRLNPGGRLVAIVPHAGCPIVIRTIERFQGKYVPADAQAMRAVLETLPQIEWWALRGLTFRADQRTVPYEVSPWTSHDCDWQTPPNRLLLVAQAKG